MSANVRPRTITIAIALFAANIILQVVGFVFDWQQLLSPAGQTAIDQTLVDTQDGGELNQEVLGDIAQTTALVMIGVGALFNVVLSLLVILFVAKGQGVGRIIATILTAASFLFLLASWEDLYPVLDLTAIALIIAAVTFLWLPSSTQYFRAQKVERHKDIYAT